MNDLSDADAVYEASQINPVYQASPIKRHRATKAEMEWRRAALYDIVAKTEAGYTKVQTDLAQMRRAGDMPYDWITDNTRWQRKPITYRSIEQALAETARFYRKDLWADADCYV